MGISTTFVITVTGGVHQKTRLITLGTATWTTVMAMWTGAPTISRMGFLCVVWGIDNLTIFFAGIFSNFFWDKINFELTQRIVASSLFAFLQIRIEKRLCCLSFRYKNSKRQNFHSNWQFTVASSRICFFANIIEKWFLISSRYKNSKRQNFLRELTIYSRFE